MSRPTVVGWHTALITALGLGSITTVACRSPQPARPGGPEPGTPQDVRAWIGSSYPPLALDGERIGFTTLGDARVATHALIHVKVAGSTVLLLGVRGPDLASGADRWTITDVLAVPSVDAPRVFLQFGVCGVLEEGPEHQQVALDPEIVAIVARQGGPVESELLRAWRASRQTSIFSSIDPSGLACLSEG